MPQSQAVVHAQERVATAFAGLDIATANQWADLVLKGIDSEFPNKPSLVYTSKEQIVAPRVSFPAFFGCFDWHSSVHGHWLLVKVLKHYPNMEAAGRVRESLSRHLTQANLLAEAEFFGKEEQKSFERMYGWAWYLRLVTELDGWDDPDAKAWRNHCRPLEELLVRRINDYLPLLQFPIRTGEHTDTGFALGQIHDYAEAINNDALKMLVVERARGFYLNDQSYPLRYEPSGQDFFSSGWNEADLMRRVLPGDEFKTWFHQFLPSLGDQISDGTIEPVKVSDVSDGKLVHLAGLNLNRAWCLRSVADALGSNHPLYGELDVLAKRHLEAGLAYINSGHYEGDHWLATFGLYALLSDAER